MKDFLKWVRFVLALIPTAIGLLTIHNWVTVDLLRINDLALRMSNAEKNLISSVVSFLCFVYFVWSVLYLSSNDNNRK